MYNHLKTLSASEKGNNVFDLYMLPLNLTGGQEEQNLPGLLVAKPSKKTERSRSNDVFIILLSLAGNPETHPKKPFRQPALSFINLFQNTRFNHIWITGSQLKNSTNYF